MPRARREYGKIFKLTFLGLPFVMVTDADFGKQFVTNNHQYTKKGEVFTEFMNSEFGVNVLSADDEKVWKRHRSLLNPSFSDEKLSQVFDVAVQVVKEYCDCAIDASQDKSRLISSDMSSVTLDVIGRSGFGHSFHSVSKLDDEFTAAAKTMTTNISFCMVLPQWFKNLQVGIYAKFTKAKLLFSSVINNIISSRLKDGGAGFRDILQILLDASLSQSSSLDDSNNNSSSIVAESKNSNIESSTALYKPMTTEEMIANCNVLLLAGHETTALALTYALYRLATNATIQAQAQEFVDTMLQGNDPTYSDFEKLTFIHLIFKETLRLHPVATGVVRSTKSEITFKNYNIPKGVSFKNKYLKIITNVFKAVVFYVLREVQMDEDLWENPTEFNPNRFESEQVKKLLKEHPHAYAPFGIGHRSCIGKKFAMIEAIVALTMILQRYTVKLTDEKYGEMRMMSSITQSPRKPLYITFEKRK